MNIISDFLDYLMTFLDKIREFVRNKTTGKAKSVNRKEVDPITNKEERYRLKISFVGPKVTGIECPSFLQLFP